MSEYIVITDNTFIEKINDVSFDLIISYFLSNGHNFEKFYLLPKQYEYYIGKINSLKDVNEKRFAKNKFHKWFQEASFIGEQDEDTDEKDYILSVHQFLEDINFENKNIVVLSDKYDEERDSIFLRIKEFADWCIKFC